MLMFINRAVKFIEDYIRNEVLPYYGNTHTTTTISSLQTSMLRNEAKYVTFWYNIYNRQCRLFKHNPIVKKNVNNLYVNPVEKICKMFIQ